MVFLLVILVLLLGISVFVNVLLGRQFVKLGKIVLNMESTIEECLDGLDNVYQNVGKILQQPLATNDPAVFQIHKELKRSREYLLLVANRLTSNWQSEDIGTKIESGS